MANGRNGMTYSNRPAPDMMKDGPGQHATSNREKPIPYRRRIVVMVAVSVLAMTIPLERVEADEAGAQAEQEQVVRGTVMATWCYAMEGSAGIALRNASGQRNCIYRGSPIGIKDDERVYVVSEPDPEIKKQLMPLLGKPAIARGVVYQERGQLAIRVSRVEQGK